MKNLEKYKEDLKRLLETGDALRFRMEWECKQERYEKALEKENPEIREEVRKMLEELPPFAEGYQAWYSEAKTLIRQLLPDRLDDFVGYYEKPKGRKDISYENYHISDYLLDLHVTRSMLEKTIVGPDAAIPRFRQQLAIVKAVKRRFESSLFDIRQIVQADLFDSELEAATALVKHGFLRPAGVLAGVVMEKQLAQVCENRGLKTRKRNPTIGDYNDMLKKADVVEVSQWRFNQHLGDIRNACAHKKDAEPTRDQVNDLVAGVMKVTKTLF